MDRADLEGATAAARYFLELYPYAYNTGDLAAWKAMSHPDCIFCASVVEHVEALHAQGGYETGGDLTFESVTASEPIEGNPYYGVDFEVLQGESIEFDQEGNVVRIAESNRYTMDLALARNDSGWLVRGVSHETVEE